jgi:hypothetical protein
VTVNVSASAAGTVTNVATVSGGGQNASANDTASDNVFVGNQPGIPGLSSLLLLLLLSD